jgi:prolipoprotein diacylglyceryl transferase
MSHALIALPGMRLGIPSPDPLFSHFSIGPVTIQTYALCILAAITAAVIITRRRLAARGGQPGQVLDIIVWAVPFGIVGARIYHVVTHSGDYFYPGANPLDLFAIWEGGVAIYGGLIGGAIGAYVGCRRAGIRLLSFADVLAPAMLVAQAIGRLGNWFNQELFGRPTDVPWALEIDPEHRPEAFADSATFHPTFAYEALWNLALAGLLVWIERRHRLRPGQLFIGYVAGYAAGRLWVEALRVDPASELWGLRVNIWTSILALAAALGVLAASLLRPSSGSGQQRRANGYEDAEETTADTGRSGR